MTAPSENICYTLLVKKMWLWAWMGWQKQSICPHTTHMKPYWVYPTTIYPPCRIWGRFVPYSGPGWEFSHPPMLAQEIDSETTANMRTNVGICFAQMFGLVFRLENCYFRETPNPEKTSWLISIKSNITARKICLVGEIERHYLVMLTLKTFWCAGLFHGVRCP